MLFYKLEIEGEKIKAICVVKGKLKYQYLKNNNKESAKLFFSKI